MAILQKKKKAKTSSKTKTSCKNKASSRIMANKILIKSFTITIIKIAIILETMLS